jgi:hypothetical protein
MYGEPFLTTSYQKLESVVRMDKIPYIIYLSLIIGITLKWVIARV